MATSVICPVYVPKSLPLVFTCTSSVLPFLLAMPEVAPRCNQPWLPASTEAVHVTGCGQFPVILSTRVCAGGFGSSRVAANARRAGVTCNVHGCGTGVPGVGVAPGPGVGVPGAAVLVGSGDGVVDPGVPDTGVPVEEVPEAGVEVPVLFPGMVADGESMVSCTISVCERISVRRSTHATYVP